MGGHYTASSGSNIWMIVGIVFGFIAVAVISFIAGRCPCKRKDHTNAPSSEREGLKVIREETA
uniref:Uncharacterized protein n=1 Tax=Anguilla anguilla TaxID=7936 RepID=A0A0E9XBJ9_ANGAN